MFCKKVWKQLRDALVCFPDWRSSGPQAFAMASCRQPNIDPFHFGQGPRRNFQFPD